MNLKNLQADKIIFSNNSLLRIIVIVESFIIIISRRSDALFNPQFFAEDASWYSNAYHYGIGSLIIPSSGYFHAIPRLVGLFSQIFPFSDAPLIFNLAAVGIELAVVNLLISNRLAEIIPNLFMRIIIAFVYLANPNSNEVNINLTNLQWHACILMFLIVIAKPSKRMGWKIFDILTVILSSLTGPFCIFLLPIAFIRWFYTKEKWTLYMIVIFLVASLIQFYPMAVTERPYAEDLGASIKNFSRMVGGQIFVGSIISGNGYQWLIENKLWKDLSIALINLIGFSLLIYGALKSKIELKLFILFSTLVFAASIISPISDPKDKPWDILINPNVTGRYWFIPTLCFIVTIFDLAAYAKSKTIKIISIIIILLMPIGITSGLKVPPFKDYLFKKYAQEFENAPSGTEVTIPINPDWEMKLRKK